MDEAKLTAIKLRPWTSDKGIYSKPFDSLITMRLSSEWLFFDIESLKSSGRAVGTYLARRGPGLGEERPVSLKVRLASPEQIFKLRVRAESVLLSRALKRCFRDLAIEAWTRFWRRNDKEFGVEPTRLEHSVEPHSDLGGVLHLEEAFRIVVLYPD